MKEKIFEQDKVVLEDKIVYYRNLLESPIDFVKLIESTNELLDGTQCISPWKTWRSSTVFEEVYGEYKDCSKKYSSSTSDINTKCIEIVSEIENIMNLCSADYSKQIKEDVGFADSFRIQKYNTGQQMGNHVDNQDYNDSFQKLSFSLVFYINDDYEGGEIEFKEQGIKIKPEAGSLIMFPSVAPYYHRAHIITAGNKYMAPGFWYKP